MASLKALRNRIASVKATQKITKAKQMVAAAKLRKAQMAAEAARPYEVPAAAEDVPLNPSDVARSADQGRRTYSDSLRDWYANNRAADSARENDRLATAELNRRQSAAGNARDSYAAGGGSSASDANRPSYRDDPGSYGDGRYTYYGDSYTPPYRTGRYGPP